MPQSLACLKVHLIFSTKRREPLLTDPIRQSLHNYIAVVLQNFGCPADLINSVEDHIHILLELSRTASISQTVEEIKTTSSKWLKTQNTSLPALTRFAWQSGYAVFAVSQSNVQSVRNYIANQREHHRAKTFMEEYRAFLEKHKIPYDERYVWD
jgi:putative transposase